MNGRRLLLIAAFLAAALHWHQPAVGEDAPPDKPVRAPQSPSADVAAEAKQAGPSGVTETALEEIRQKAKTGEKLTDKAQLEIIELCDKTTAKLAEAERLGNATASLQKELADAGRDLESLQSKAAPFPIASVPTTELSADEMRGRLSAADQRVSAARERAQQVDAEIDRRAARRKALPELLAKCREQLDNANKTLTERATDDVALLAEARRLYHIARRDLFEKELLSLEQEKRTYAATSRLWLARRDAAHRRLQLANTDHKAIHDLAAKVQRREAERQARKARRAAVNAHPVVKEAAAKTAELAERNQALVSETLQIEKRLAEVRELAKAMRTRVADVTKRATTAKNSPVTGVMLRSQQDQLPVLGPFRARLQNSEVEISQLGLDLYDWESQRREALHVDKAVDLAIQEIEAATAESMREETTAELRRVFEARAAILAELISNANDCLSQLEELEAADTEVVATTERLASFIAEQVLWVRSAPILSRDEINDVKTFWLDVASRIGQAKETVATLRPDARLRPLWWGLAVILTLGLIVGRGRARSILCRCGEAAAKPTATSFRPTIEAALVTIFLSSPIPVVCGFIGWRLCHVGDSLAYATGWAAVLFAGGYAMLNLVRHASRCGGLGTSHFGWDERGIAAIGNAARSTQLLALPLLAVSFGVEISGNESSINSLGRLSLISALLVIGVVCVRLFRPAGALRTALVSSSKNSSYDRWPRILAPVATLAVLGLTAASAAGYHYTAMQLTRRALVSCLFVFACLALRSLLMRWLLVAYRRAAMQRAREKRQAMQQAQENASSENPFVETDPQVSLSDINQQARRLVGVGAGLTFLISMSFVWHEVLPALGIFSQVELWPSGLVMADPDAGQVFITLTDLIIAGGVLAFTWFAGRNLPGLLEIAVLQKLPLDAGARYAASSMTRYVMVVAGVALGMRQLGIGWNSVQWLVAAMTVGLGFGLQEIVANFVSGIILLFERPARVGDTVTVGQVTGTVTRIRIRATTILDWDNKELIVPNKDFVTGNLVNWTLTNPHVRMIIKVGIAYGSDTRLATELLYRVIEKNPDVLDSPEPIVVFNEFGESSLNFELRLFVGDLIMYRCLRHDLHLAIDDLFRQHNIEIAFPQCDLHVKAMPVASSGVQSGPLSASRSVEIPDPQSSAA